ncbi:type VI secretion system membrane subunit TssM [Methylocaldum szegediense]|uniref:Type VI secretion system protein ImpL n=1 Tax=Methylocaldum szegediense TaxID=73780 RepID=A0ABN8X0M6_9GAMM|nr:type VI secretion system membrane subunit TssM [Methylocaldum szegediense]CAI8798043.1 type VI secretion system protein ImpL [Methylocaldum szegediense]
MKGVINFLKNKWVVQAVGIIALCALIWFIGPLIGIAGSEPLASEWARGLTMAVVVVFWIIWRLVAEIRAGRKDRQLAQDLAAPGEGGETKSAEAAAVDENIEILTENFTKALKLLQETRGGKQHLYELPWYIIIGPPGSGKTTALLNSGLKFPLADRLGSQPIRGVSGTRNCEWLFTNDAVLIDTAGRYTTQESYQAVDAAEWAGFLKLLKQHRPRRPINGVLVTMSLSDLLQQTEEERTLHAKAIRRRVQELYSTLGIRFPIYMLFTKCDLVAGFNDFFADLTQEERAQVWGETFPAENPKQPLDVLSLFSSGYDELLQRLNRRMQRRIQEERDIQRRSLILDYPQQMALLKPLMERFLEDAFGANRYEERPLLRGIYLTCGTQEGTPIDRVMGILAATFRLNRQAVPIFSGRGKSFFLTRLLKDVIFQEAELAGLDPKIERRRRLVQAAAYGSVLILALGCIIAWLVSYQRNTSAIERVEQEIERYRAAKINVNDWPSSLRTFVPKVDPLLAINDIYENSGALSHFGLYQGEKIQLAANHAYEHWLREYFLPVNLQRLAQRMSGPEASNPDVLYELLRVYLMLGQPDRMDAKIAGPWIRSDWESRFNTEPDLLARLNLHLDNLLKLRLDPQPMDEALIASVRAKLSQVPQTIQLYSRFKNEALLDRSHDFKLGPALGPDAGRVFVAADGRDIGTLMVPGLFTAYGYSELFLKQSLDYIKDAVTENWVLGKQANVDLAEIQRLHGDFRTLYLSEYQKTWSDLLSNIKLRRPKDINQTIEWLDILSRPTTPVRRLLEAVEKNTSLTKIASLTAQLLNKVPAVAEAKIDDRTQKLLDAARQAEAGSSSQADPVQSVEAAFEELSYLVRSSGETPAPLNSTLATLASLRDYMLQIGSAALSGEQALKSASGRIGGGGGDVLLQAKTEFGRLPEPLKGWFLSFLTVGWGQTLAGAKKELNDMLKTAVATPCKAAFSGRYPFLAGSSKDATLMDFAKFFAPNGVLDQFFQTNLKTFVDVNRPVWTEVAMDKQSLGLSPATIRQFQNASAIRSAFFSAGGQLPSVSFELKPIALDENVATFRFNLEGQEVVYRHGPEQVTRLQWPGPSSGAGVRVVFEAVDGRQVSRSKEGSWAFFRLLDEAVLEKTDLPERFLVTFRVEGYSARYELRAGSVTNPFGLTALKTFSCPEAL